MMQQCRESKRFKMLSRPVLACLSGLCISLLLLTTCGDGNVCQQACERMKSCGKAQLAKLDCDDPMYKNICDAIHQALEMDCSMATDEACVGDYRAESARTMNCDMDPNTCYCPRNICMDVCLEQKDCAESNLESLDCADTSNQVACDALKPMAQQDCYSISDESCTGDLKTSAEEIDSCFLDHTTCTCSE